MKQSKRWHLSLIIGVIFLTVYNVLPTVFFYSKPLKAVVDEKKGREIAFGIASRVNQLEDDAISWLKSYCNLLKIKPSSIRLDPLSPQFIEVKFNDLTESNRLRSYLPRAGSLVSFVPSQLSVYDRDSMSKVVVVQRRVPIHIDPGKIENYFQFGIKYNDKGVPSDFYRNIVNDRLLFLGALAGGASENASLVQAAVTRLDDPEGEELLFLPLQNILNFIKIFDENSAIAKRYFSSFSQIDVPNRRGFIDLWIRGLERIKDQFRLKELALIQEQEEAKKKEGELGFIKKQQLDVLHSQGLILADSLTLIKRHISDLTAGNTPLTFSSLATKLKKNDDVIFLEGLNPFIQSLRVDWENDRIVLEFYPEIQQMKDRATSNYLKEQIDQFIYANIVTLSRQSGELIRPYSGQFEIALSDLVDSKTFLATSLSNIAEVETKTLQRTLLDCWVPKHPDLDRSVFPIWDFKSYEALPKDQKKLGLVIFAPSTQMKIPPSGFKMDSIYVIARGVDKILGRFESQGNSDSARQFIDDFKELRSILQRNGFVGYSGATYPMNTEFKSDFLFEKEGYYQDFIKATRENFSVNGTKRHAVLEFGNVEQRMITENKIDDAIHEDLLKWRDDYQTAQVDLKETSKRDIPAPTKSLFLSNARLSFLKYFRGNDKKILHWGLDLSGGKTVQIEFRDSSNQVVTNESDIEVGINELYNRVNKMGVSEVTIRKEGGTVALDFPGSQLLSATELVKASSMIFHIVNEKFMTNPLLSKATHHFLQDVWNEAMVTNKKSNEEINSIAWRHLYGESADLETAQPRTPSARLLYESGLRLPYPQERRSSSNYDETFSKIEIFRGEDFRDWHGQTHPLLIVFKNYALEGSNLENIRASYDPSKGNFLSFGVRGSQIAKDGMKYSPRDDLQAWTSQFAKEKIIGSPTGDVSQGNGWRMAVVLNDFIITAPSLDSVLRESASITGSFTQREINRLEADLKAGSLSFKPVILSEKNVSPELGSQERIHGIIAAITALMLSILIMVSYYRFGGLIASIAVVFNLLIMWATLQNLGATLTLSGIAAIILTVAMAVDANVLVFERIREEFASSGRITTAVYAGYRKAFSAILDSNITTLIAALVLMNFDAGPIRGFAVTLIIGIASSLFTALFMTRFFFTWWIKNPKNQELKMSNLIKGANFNFLKFTKPTLIVSGIVIFTGISLFFSQKETIFGMDFTGGYALTLKLQPASSTDYRARVEQALIKQGLTTQEFQIRELSPANHIRIFLSHSLDQKGHLFADLPSTSEENYLYRYENNKKITWIVSALEASSIQISPVVLQDLDKNWTSISGQMSETMRFHALIGLSIALLTILAYITIRFEFKYAISAILCLIHDVIFCIGFTAILHFMGTPIQIDLHAVAALMTIVGYSLNDTIIVFDRIREDIRASKKKSFKEVINHALNTTLSRTLMTSGITLVVLIPLVILGGSTIFGFALILIVGIVFGTLSSLFIAAPLMQHFHNKKLNTIAALNES